MNYAVTLCFNNPRVIEQSLERFYLTRNNHLQLTHVLVDQHYPLNRKQVRRYLEDAAKRWGCLLLDPGENLGLHRGFNYALKMVDFRKSDIVIGYDPDSFPVDQGWDMALVRALQGNDQNAWASLMNPRSKTELLERGFTKSLVDGYIETWTTKAPVVNSICAWKGSFLKDVGGLWEPMPYYGHLECAMWERLQVKHLNWVFLPGWTEDDRIRDLTDREYTWWKWRHSHLKDWPGDFASYVEAGCPTPSDFVKLP